LDQPCGLVISERIGLIIQSPAHLSDANHLINIAEGLLAKRYELSCNRSVSVAVKIWGIYTNINLLTRYEYTLYNAFKR